MSQNSVDINRGQAIAFNGGHAMAFDRAREIGSYGPRLLLSVASMLNVCALANSLVSCITIVVVTF